LFVIPLKVFRDAHRAIDSWIHPAPLYLAIHGIEEAKRSLVVQEPVPFNHERQKSDASIPAEVA
jgi:hypothetical protein